MDKSYAKICPKCRSKEIMFEATDFGLYDVCKSCGFRMSSFPEIELSKKKKKK